MKISNIFKSQLLRSHKPRKNILQTVFLHVPKCGGTTIENALKECYRSKYGRFEIEPNIDFRSFMQTLNVYSNSQSENEASDSYHNVSQALLAYKMSRGAALLTGHFTISKLLLDNFSNDYSFITVLREPSDRWISNYIYSRIRLSQKGLRDEVKSLKDELLYFMESNAAIREGSIYSFYFGEKESRDISVSNDDLNQAITNLSMFKMVGFLDSIEDFKKGLEKHLCEKLNIEHARKTAAEADPLGYGHQDYRDLFDESIVKTVKELCKMDYKIYEFCKNKFNTGL